MFLLRLNSATVHRVFTRYHLARLAHLDAATGRPVQLSIVFDVACVTLMALVSR
jgi:hypothetical protein